MYMLPLMFVLAALAVPIEAYDTVYVHTQTEGVYEAWKVCIEPQSTRQMIWCTTSDGKRLHISPRLASHVEVSREGRSDQEFKAVSDLADLWNRETPLVLTAVQGVPFAGGPLEKIAERIPPGMAYSLAVLTLTAFFAFVAYKAWEIGVVSREMQALTLLKLKLDIAKVRYEALNLAAAGTTQERELIESLRLPMPEEEPAERTTIFGAQTMEEPVPERTEATAPPAPPRPVPQPQPQPIPETVADERFRLPLLPTPNTRARRQARYYERYFAAISTNPSFGGSVTLRMAVLVIAAVGFLTIALSFAPIGVYGFFVELSSGNPSAAMIGVAMSVIGVLFAISGLRLFIRVIDMGAALSSARRDVLGA